MAFVIDLSIALAALLAAAYCMVLSRRLHALTRLDGDVGKAIAILSQQVDALSDALRRAEQTNTQASSVLDAQLERADATARRLELMMAAHGGTSTPPPQPDAPPQRDEPFDPIPEFAPFGRAGSRNTDPRARVVRQRDGHGIAR